MGRTVDRTGAPRVLTRGQAADLGYSRQQVDWRLRAGHWRRVLPRTYFTGDVFGWLDRLDAAVAFAGPDARLSGAAALVADGFRVERPSRVLVLVPPRNRLESIDWVQVRATRRFPGRELGPGPPRAALARSVADHGLTCRRIDDVRAVVAAAVRTGRCTLDELQSELTAGPRNGSGRLRQALAEVAHGAASAPEARAATILRRAGVGPFEQNVRIDLPDGRYYVADLLCRSRRAILEIDSVEFHIDPAAWRGSLRRHFDLETLGYSVVHVPPSELRDEWAFVRRIRAWLASRDPLLLINSG